MLEFLQSVDEQLFYFINGTLSNGFFDWFMPFVTQREHWYPVWITAILLMIWKGGRKGQIGVILVILIVILTDRTSAHLIKPLADRIRPCQTLEDVNLLVNCTKSKSFPSAHATNFFAAATFFAVYYRRYLWVFFSIATIVALSRVFVGVHYPFDILAGAVLGTIISWSVLWLYRQFVAINKVSWLQWMNFNMIEGKK